MSGSTIGGIAGGVIGFFAGNPQLGFMIGSAIGGYLDPAQIEGPRLKDAQVQTSDEGVPRPIIYGTFAVAGNLIQRGPLIERKHTERAGKGGPEQTTYRYYMSYAVRVCEGPAQAISRIWRDDKLVYDVRPGAAITADTAAFKTKLTIYLGGESQLPDPTLEALPAENGGGAGNVPAYRGTCYVVFENDDLTERNGTVPQYRFEVMSVATEAPVETSGLEAAGIAQFRNAPDPRVGAEDEYTYQGHWHDGDGAGQSSSVFETLEEVFEWVETLAGEQPTFHIGYIGTTDGIAGNQYSSTVQFNVVGEQPDVTDFTSVVMLYQWILPEDWHDVAPNELCPLTTLTEYQGARNGSVGIKAGAVGPNPQIHQIVQNCSVDTWVYAVYPLCIEIFRKRVAPSPAPDGSLELPDKPGWWLTEDGEIVEGKQFDGEVSGTFKVLSKSVATGSDPSQSYAFYEHGPAVASGDPNYTSQAYWDAAYADAVAAGNLPAGMTYSPGGNGPEGSTYPQLISTVWDRAASSAVTVTPGAVILADVVEDIAERVGLAADQLDLTALTDSVTGYAVARQMPASEAVKPLQQVYFFDFPEWDLKLRAVKRGGAIIKTLEDDDFIQSDDDEEVRGQAVEFPRKLNLYHADPDANYARVPAPAERYSQNVKATGEMAIEAPLSLTRAEAVKMADKQLKVAWEELQGRLERKLPSYVHADLVPSDVIAYDSKRWRIVRTEVSEGVLSIEAKRDRASNYGSTATPNTILNPTTPVSSTKGPTIFQAMNLPSLRSADDEPGIYVAATGLLPGWAGCDLYLSTDGGASEQFVLRMTARAVMGYLLEDITATQDDSNGPIPVRLYDGRQLDSVTQAQLDARQNAFALVTDDVSEIAQVETVTEDSSGDYELADVARGLLGTTAAPHDAGDRFVLLDAAVYFLPLDIGLSGQTLILRPVSIGTVPANNPTYSVVFDPPTFIRDGGVVAA